MKKWKAIIVLLTIAVGIISPHSLSYWGDHATASVGTLDVCHSAVPALSSNGDMPCAGIACPCQQLPLVNSRNNNIFIPPSKHFLIAVEDERPPEA